jgi:long-subunit acyl-CoA synthetase (AMP-forming)
VLSATAQEQNQEDIKKQFESLLKETNKALNQYEKLSQIVLIKEPWSIENGLLTPTMKVKRNIVEKLYTDSIPAWSNRAEKVLVA